MFRFAFQLLTIIFCISAFAQKKNTIIYTGNMGVLIYNDRFSVLIDGLHEEYGVDYVFPSQELVKKINTKFKPDVILFTHHHGDHFSNRLATEYLQNNSEALLFGPKQVTKNLSEFGKRITTINTKNYDKQTQKLKNTTITGMKLNHVGKRHEAVQNVGYIIEQNKIRILHVGDTDWFEEINLFEQLSLSSENIDILILPYWMLLQNSAPELIKKYIHPKHLIATHIPPKIENNELLELRKKYKNIHLLTNIEQEIHF
ncbi:MBL fold metallo-hydrolase [Aquimarina pacifica]|uniref:MBL fold metallo-hydrolase n=1 Tax=Aquimarina pacifica TaxID=1296415 RepID=UPI0004708D14|nr:MBL fold metallo-hydrolase [Aquimarina pacifica]